MATPYSDTNSDDLSNALFENLTTDAAFELPAVDLNDAMYNLSDTTDNPLYAEVNRLELSEITTREIGGTGAFDALMDAYSKHIEQEYEKGRITGTEYAQAYVQLTSNAMQQAIQFLLGKDQAYWSALLVQAQSKAAEIAAIHALVELARMKAEYSMVTLGIEKSKAEYALIKMQLATEDAKFDHIKTQDEIEEYRLVNIMPTEHQQLQEQVQTMVAQRLNIEQERAKLLYEVNTLMPDQHLLNLNQISMSEKQGEKIDAEITAINFDIQQMLPAKLVQMDAQTDAITADTAKAAYELSTLLPDQHNLSLAQIEKMETEVDMVQYDLTNVKPVELQHLQAQTALTESQSSKAAYELATLLPDQHNQNLKELELADNQILKSSKEVEMMDFQLTDMLPATLTKMTAEITQITTQNAKISAERDGVIYTTNFMMPTQRENVIADTSVKQYQADFVLPATVANTESETLVKEYTRNYLLPAQLNLTREQAEAKRAETLNSRTDGAAVTGSIGKQKDLYTQQIESYKRDAEMKVGRLAMDAWITSKGIDEATPTPAELQVTALNNLVTTLKQRNAI